MLGMITSTRNGIYFHPGDRVRGVSYGEEVVGTVRSARGHTINPNWQIVSVKLDTPTVKYGTERTGVHFDLDWEGNGDHGCYLRKVDP